MTNVDSPWLKYVIAMSWNNTKSAKVIIPVTMKKYGIRRLMIPAQATQIMTARYVGSWSDEMTTYGWDGVASNMTTPAARSRMRRLLL